MIGSGSTNRGLRIPLPPGEAGDYKLINIIYGKIWYLTHVCSKPPGFLRFQRGFLYSFAGPKSRSGVLIVRP